MQALAGLLVLVLAVAVLVAGYYLGIFFALIGAALTAIAIIVGIFIFVCYAIWDLLQERKRRKRAQRLRRVLKQKAPP